MSNFHFGPIIIGDDIKRELRVRSSKLEYKTVKGSKMALIMEKVAVEEKEGWKKEKRNKNSYKLSKPKPNDEQLEDELWCIFAKMGFKELSSGRNFKIETKKDPNPRQLDVFAKDDEVALVVECTQCTKPTKKDISKLIEKISSIKSGVSKSITQYYGRDAKIKPKFIIATRNIEWGKAYIEKCNNEGISILTEIEIDYYKNLVQHLKSAARYQFNAHIFGGTEIPALTKTVPATRGIMGGVNFYNFLIAPDELLKISYVGHKGSRTEEDLETYQRMLQPKRMKAIAKYINDGGKFPTNIVINIKTGKKKLVFEKQFSTGDVSVGNLILPKFYGAAWVIDGQHRLYGYAYRNLEDGPNDDKSVLSVLAFENLPPDKEMDMFIDINSKQVKVQKGLLIELYSDLHWNSPDPSERILALHARIVSRLNKKKTSPIFDRVVVTGKGKNSNRCLTQASISDGLKATKLLGSVKKGQFYPGPLAHHDPHKTEKSLEKAINVISEVLILFANEMPEHWALGDRPGGYLCTNIAVRSIFHVMMDICVHVTQKTGADLSTWSSEEIFSEIRKYIEPIVNYFKNANNEQIKSFRSVGSSLAAVKKQSMGMNVFIQNKFNDYEPDGLKEYKQSRDDEGNDIALLSITRIQDRIFRFVIKTLKAHYTKSPDEWWTEGIPTNVRLSCSSEWEKKKRENNVETYLYLLNYEHIASANWEIFGKYFALGENDIGNRKKCVEWINKLNDIRNTTHHPEKGKLNPEQVSYVDMIAKKVEEYFPDIPH